MSEKFDKNISRREREVSDRNPDPLANPTGRLWDMYFNYHSNEERKNGVLDEFDSIIQNLPEESLSEATIEDMRRQLLDACEANTPQQFTMIARAALTPFFEFWAENRRIVEQAQRKSLDTRRGFTELNALFSYELKGDSEGSNKQCLVLHIPTSYTLENKRAHLKDAMQKLKVVLEENPNIARVEGTSHLVTKNHRLFERLGFRIEDVKDTTDDFPYSPSRAYMNRDTFFSLYGQET